MQEQKQEPQPLQEPTRKQYLDGEVTHRQFYAAIVAEAGIRFEANDPLVQRALVSTDPHYNNIPLPVWDRAALWPEPSIRRALKLHGDFYSLAGGVCVMKEAVRQAVERIKEDL